MAIRTQRWTPDTCANPASQDSCIIEETWDDSVPSSARIHSVKTVIRRCSAHSGLVADQDAYEANKNDNARKNIARNIVRLHFEGSVDPDSLDALMQSIEWSFDASRVLLLTIPGVAVSDRNAIQSACDVQFGPNLVIVL